VRIYRRTFKTNNKSVIMFAKKTPILFCILLIAFSLSMHGQEEQGSKAYPLNYSDISNNEIVISEITTENQDLKRNLAWMDIVDLNLITLRQMGQQNQATIQQISQTKNPNLVMVSQNGNQNISDIHQSGSRNALKLIQEGEMNSFSATYEGTYLINSIEQNGHLNVIEQTLTGSDMDFSIIQRGNGHEVIQLESGQGIGYSVTQSGRDMKVSIEQGHVMIK
jgi:hypothetical protein